MSDTAIRLVFVAFVIICVVGALAGCGVKPEQVAEAEKLCAPHGGLETLYIVPEQIWCKNGIEIEFLESYRK